MDILNMILVTMASFNLVLSINLMRDLYKSSDNSFRCSNFRMMTIVLILIMITTATYIPLDILYCSGEKLESFQDISWSVYEGVIHFTQFMFMMLIKYKLMSEDHIHGNI